MKSLLLSLLLLIAGSVPSLAAALPIPQCVPYRTALTAIAADGGHLVGHRATVLARSASLLYFSRSRTLFVTGVLGDDACVFLPAAEVGPLAPGLDAL